MTRIATSGLALVYKTGELKIHFSLREFHVVLQSGAIPLAAFERHVEDFIIKVEAVHRGP